MFRQIRYQTGEINEIIAEMRKGNIPCMDVDDSDDMSRFISELEERNIYQLPNISPDKDARNRVNEPEFEFRIAFSETSQPDKENNINGIMYIDFYFEPDIEESYDSIFGD